MTNRETPASVPFRCQIGLHKPMPSKLWNDGFYFTVCQACNQYMIRKPGAKWQLVPRDYRVVWRPRGEDDISWPSHVL